MHRSTRPLPCKHPLVLTAVTARIGLEFSSSDPLASITALLRDKAMLLVPTA
jgi:hypothetical protein